MGKVESPKQSLAAKFGQFTGRDVAESILELQRESNDFFDTVSRHLVTQHKRIESLEKRMSEADNKSRIQAKSQFALVIIAFLASSASLCMSIIALINSNN